MDHERERSHRHTNSPPASDDRDGGGTHTVAAASSIATSGRLSVSRALGVAGVVVYNWWVVVPFLHGWLSSLDGFFSDLSADGQVHAVVLRRLDMVSAALILGALLIRGPVGRAGPRREWRWLVAFGAAAMIGARFPYACAEGLDAACRSAERHLELAPHHYVHMAAGIAEFTTATVAIWLAYRRTRGTAAPEGRLAQVLMVVLVVAYPILGVAYLGDRLGSLVEPVFFVSFSAMVLIEVFEPVGAPDGSL
ncbi:MAG TPA: DUF998 domain-containing protein, partial [Acidimicrobiales bacterium]